LLEGRIWQTTISELDGAARQLVSEGVRILVLDLSQVDYLNSSALGAIEKLSTELAGLGGRLVLRNPTAPVRVALELSGGLVQLIEPAAP
jgi:anti-anti-sigma factor